MNVDRVRPEIEFARIHRQLSRLRKYAPFKHKRFGFGYFGASDFVRGRGFEDFGGCHWKGLT